MVERRKSRRMDLECSLIIKRLSDQRIEEEVPIEVLDASKTGLGFACQRELQEGTVYEANLTIWTKEVLHTFLEIIRAEKKGNLYHYGAIFIGMSEMDASRIETYKTVTEMQD